MRKNLSWFIFPAVILAILTAIAAASGNIPTLIGILIAWGIYLLVSLAIIIESLIRCSR